jgi:hypothetical protein
MPVGFKVLQPRLSIRMPGNQNTVYSSENPYCNGTLLTGRSIVNNEMFTIVQIMTPSPAGLQRTGTKILWRFTGSVNDRPMTQNLIKRVEDLITRYKKEHRGEAPSYIILSPEDGDALTEEVKGLYKQEKKDMITSYKDSKIIKNIALNNGAFYVSSELPETGS